MTITIKSDYTAQELADMCTSKEFVYGCCPLVGFVCPFPNVNCIDVTADHWHDVMQDDEPADPYELPIAKLRVSTRTTNSLRRHHIRTVGRLLELSASNLSDLDGVGAKGVAEVQRALAEHGLHLPEDTKYVDR